MTGYDLCLCIWILFQVFPLFSDKLGVPNPTKLILIQAIYKIHSRYCLHNFVLCCVSFFQIKQYGIRVEVRFYIFKHLLCLKFVMLLFSVALKRAIGAYLLFLPLLNIYMLRASFFYTSISRLHWSIVFW